MTPLISVVICTYNRSDLLALALETLCQQALETSQFEVIVIDNNSTDDTQAVTKTFTARQGNIRYVLETKQGLSHARNRGWHEAQADYVAYCDDDCKLPEHWLKTAVEVIHTHAPAMFGASSKPFYITEPPHWFLEKYSIQRLVQQEPGALQNIDWLGGFNMFIDKKYLQRMGGFNPELGMTAETIAYAEETFFIRELKTHYPEALIYFHPDLTVYHLVRPEKMSLGWRLRDCFALGRDSYKVSRDRYQEKRALPSFVLERLVKLAIPIVRSTSLMVRLPFRSRQQYPYWQNYIYETMCRPAKSAGNWWAQVKFYRQNRAKSISDKQQPSGG